MKKIFSILMALFIVGIAQAQQAVATTPQQAITYFFDGLSELNDTKMRTYLTSDFLLLEDGEVWNADSLSKNFVRFKGTDFRRKNTFKFIRNEVQGKTATVVYHNRAEVMVNGKPFVVEWMESALLVKEKNNWKIKMLHSTVIKSKSTP
jgi:hypothetical protein